MTLVETPNGTRLGTMLTQPAAEVLSLSALKHNVSVTENFRRAVSLMVFVEDEADAGRKVQSFCSADDARDLIMETDFIGGPENVSLIINLNAAVVNALTKLAAKNNVPLSDAVHHAIGILAMIETEVDADRRIRSVDAQGENVRELIWM